MRHVQSCSYSSRCQLVQAACIFIWNCPQKILVWWHFQYTITASGSQGLLLSVASVDIECSYFKHGQWAAYTVFLRHLNRQCKSLIFCVCVSVSANIMRLEHYVFWLYLSLVFHASRTFLAQYLEKYWTYFPPDFQHWCILGQWWTLQFGVKRPKVITRAAD